MTKPSKGTKSTATDKAQATEPVSEDSAIVERPAELNEAESTETKLTEAESTEANATTSAITPAETQAVTPVKPVVTDPYDYTKTAVTISYTFLPEDGHPEGRTVLVSLHTTGQSPLFSQVPLREKSEALKDAVKELQERYKVYLPEHRLKVEQEEAEKAAAAKLASAAITAAKVKEKVPTQHAKALATNDAVTVSEKRLSLFG